jgi:hypothetical protein
VIQVSGFPSRAAVARVGVEIRLAAVRAVLPAFYFRAGNGDGVGKQHRLVYAAPVEIPPKGPPLA